MEETDLKDYCFFCGRSATNGPHKYQLDWDSKYQLLICHNCQNANLGGLRHDWDHKFERHLTERNLPFPEKNADGYYPVPGNNIKIASN